MDWVVAVKSPGPWVVSLVDSGVCHLCQTRQGKDLGHLGDPGPYGHNEPGAWGQEWHLLPGP